jgi:hypothetical protein
LLLLLLLLLPLLLLLLLLLLLHQIAIAVLHLGRFYLTATWLSTLVSLQCVMLWFRLTTSAGAEHLEDQDDQNTLCAC